MTDQERLKEIMRRIRCRKDWNSSHMIINTPLGSVGYYDSIDRDDYFTIKYKSFEVNHKNSGVLCIEYPSFDAFHSFSLDIWLIEVEKALDSIAIPKQVVIDGFTYIRQDPC